MTDKKPDTLNLKNVKIKMPEEDFFNSEPEVKPVSLMPLVIVGLILVLIAILGGLVWWGMELSKIQESETPLIITRPVAELDLQTASTSQQSTVESENVTAPVVTTALEPVTPQELEGIQSDLSSTTVDNLTDELRTIDIILQID